MHLKEPQIKDSFLRVADLRHDSSNPLHLPPKKLPSQNRPVFRETRPRPTSTLSDTQGHRGPRDKCKWAPINLF